MCPAGGPGAGALLGALEQGGVVTAVDQLYIALATGTRPRFVRLPVGAQRVLERLDM